MKEAGYAGPRASAWPRRLAQGPSRMIEPDELRSWIVHEDDRLLVVNKPGDVVCHPSKHGPWSSLVGAAREALRAGDRAPGLPARPRDKRDRRPGKGSPNGEPAAEGRCRSGSVAKTYLAVLTGELAGDARVDQPLGDDTASPVFMKSAVRPDGQASVTRFEPLARGGGFTLARVTPETGRKHQIRAHAQWLGHSGRGRQDLRARRPALPRFHRRGLDARAGGTPAPAAPGAALRRIDLAPAGIALAFDAPLPPDMPGFCERHGLACRNSLRLAGPAHETRSPSRSAARSAATRVSRGKRRGRLDRVGEPRVVRLEVDRLGPLLALQRVSGRDG